MTSDSSIDSVDESGKAFKKYLSQRRKDPNDAKDTASAAVEVFPRLGLSSSESINSERITG